MSDDTRRILEMLSEGKVSIEEAQRLLAAVGGTGDRGATTSRAVRATGAKRFINMTLPCFQLIAGFDLNQPP